MVLPIDTPSLNSSTVEPGSATPEISVLSLYNTTGIPAMVGKDISGLAGGIVSDAIPDASLEYALSFPAESNAATT